MSALIDTGATDNFIDRTLVPDNLRSTTPHPISITMVDGTRAQDVTEYLITDLVSSNHGPTARTLLLITDLPSECPVILGMSWCYQTRPTFDWVNGALQFPIVPESYSELVDSLSIPTASRLAAAKSSSATVKPGSAQGSSFFFDPDEDQDDIEAILRTVPSEYHEFLDVFSKVRAERLPPHRPYDHSIDLVDGVDLPTVGPIYSTSAAESSALKAEINSLLSKGFIRTSTAPIGAPVLFVKKKDLELRMCIDYRQINLRTKKNKYPLPPINFLLEQLAGAKIYSKIDLRGAYHLLRIAAGHEWKTTFRCRYGSFEFLVMPFGLTNAPSAFQHLMNDIFREHLDQFVIVYLDDILVFSTSKADHDNHVRTVLSLLRANNLFAKATKCIFGASEVEFLGYLVGVNGLRMDPAKVQAITDWPTPSNLKAVQSFLGFANFYRRFIRDYSKVVSPLTALTKKDTPFQWSSQCQTAFDLLKSRFTSGPILAHFDPARETYLETDASDYAMGTILSQTGEDGLLHPVAFDSRKFLPAELNYEIHDKELLAIVWSFKRWRSMLLSTVEPVKVLTDHQALTYFMTNKQLTRRQVRWAELLADYNFAITYRPGKQSEKPDSLSRRDDVYPSGGDGAYAKNNPHNFTTLLKTHQVSGFLARAHQIDSATIRLLTADNDFISCLKRAQDQDPILQEQAAKKGQPNVKPIPTVRDDGVLLLDGRIAVPSDDAIKLQILRQKHDHPTAGHPGRTKTIQLIARDFHWRAPKDFVSDYIESCMKCARNKPLRAKPFGPLQPLPVAAKPWSSLSMDFIEKLATSETYDSILVVVCRFTKMAVFIPTFTTATSRDLAMSFISNVFSKHGLPDNIVSDRGSKFVSKFWKTLCQRLGIERRLSTAYHPETDGQTERVNQTLEQYVRIYCAYQQDDWLEWLPLAEFAYNNSDHSSTGVSPFKANYGFDPSISVERDANAAGPGNRFAYQLSDLHDRIRTTLTQARDDQKRFADRSRREHTFRVGQKVLLSTENLRTTRPMRKFAEKYIGPYEIIESINPVAFKLQLPAELSRIHPVFHVSLFRPAPESTIPGRTVEPPGPIDLEDDVYAVKQIVDSRINRRSRTLEYRVEWEGYEDTPDQFSWVSSDDIINLTDELDEFHARFPEKPKARDLLSQPTGTRSRPRSLSTSRPNAAEESVRVRAKLTRTQSLSNLGFRR